VSTIYVRVICEHLDWEVGCASQIFNAFRTVFSAVEGLTLQYVGHRIVSELCQDEDYTEWRELLTSFSNLKTPRIDDGLVQLLTRSQQLEDGNSLRELVPELRELPCIGFKDPGSPLLTPFAGCLVTLVLSHYPSQQLFQLHKLLPLSEDRFQNALRHYTVATGIRSSEHDLVIEGKVVILWALHKAVFLRNGYGSVRLTHPLMGSPANICVRLPPTTSGLLSGPLWVSLHLQVGLASLHIAHPPWRTSYNSYTMTYCATLNTLISVVV